MPFLCRFRRALAAALCLLSLAGCLSEGPAQEDDLRLAREAMQRQDIAEAKMRCERYLRLNPQGEKRREAWRSLLSITLDMRGDRENGREYLEIMLQEYAEDAPMRRDIQRRLALLCEETRDGARSSALWEALGADPEAEPERRAEAARRLAAYYLGRLEFTQAVDSLSLCLALPVSPSVKADCRYDLAETRMLNEEPGPAEDMLRELIADNGAAAERRVLAAYLLADILEQRERYDEARALFESIARSYPNPKLVEQRIAWLKGKKQKPPTSAPLSPAVPARNSGGRRN